MWNLTFVYKLAANKVSVLLPPAGPDWFCCFTGRFHSSGGGAAAGPRPGGFPPAGKRHQRKGPPARAAHRCEERRHQGRRAPPPERPQRWRGVKGTIQKLHRDLLSEREGFYLCLFCLIYNPAYSSPHDTVQEFWVWLWESSVTEPASMS